MCRGTTFVLAIADGDVRSIVERTVIPTTTPDETLAACAKWCEWSEWRFATRVSVLTRRRRLAERADRIDAIGVASFGPLDLKSENNTCVLSTASLLPLRVC